MKKALELWDDTGPQDRRFKSRLLGLSTAPTNETTIFLVRSLAISYVPIIHHWFVEFNGIQWHPGAPTDPIFQSDCAKTSQVDTRLRKIIECCNYCAKEYMRRNFCRDANFNLVFNNCQIQLGEIAESLLVIFFITSLIIAIVLKNIFIFIINLATLATIFLTRTINTEIEYKVCEHIDL